MTARDSQLGAAARYAIYWAPVAGSALASIGERWLGREAATALDLTRQAVRGFDDGELAAITAEPRRYGLHATLKPPFRLAHAFTLSALEAHIAAFANARSPVGTAPLQLARIGRFLALTPKTRSDSLDALAASCVEAFDRFRAPADAEDLARRRGTGLTAQQEENLRRWGYPYVMSEFRFHVTLTGPIDRAIAERLTPHLEALFSPAMTRPLEIDEIALFLQPAPEESFRLIRRFRLGAATS
jgi:putative phosphonate metabolism protein